MSGQKFIKNTNNSPFWRFLETWSLQSNSVTRQVSFNVTIIDGKMPDLKNSSATFWVIFKQCDYDKSPFLYKIQPNLFFRNEITLIHNFPWFFKIQKQWKNVWLLWILKQWRIFLWFFARVTLPNEVNQYWIKWWWYMCITGSQMHQ